jgi:hypothetical protein
MYRFKGTVVFLKVTYSLPTLTPELSKIYIFVDYSAQKILLSFLAGAQKCLPLGNLIMNSLYDWFLCQLILKCMFSPHCRTKI